MKVLSKKTLAIFLFILALASFLRLWKLGSQSFIADEFISIKISYGFRQSGEWKFWDFNQSQITDEKYTRGKVYYWQAAQVLKFLPPTEANARLVSAAWGVFGVMLVFAIALAVTRNAKLALLAAFLAAISVTNLMLDRKFRMYSMFAPVFFLFSFCTFKFLESSPRFALTKNWKKFCQRTGLNWNYLPAVLVLGILAYQTHKLAVNIVPVVLAYFLVMAIWLRAKNKNWKSRYSVFIFVLVILGLFDFLFLGFSREFVGKIGFFQNNWSYFAKAIFDYSHPIVAVTFFVLGAWFLVKKYSKAGIWIVVNYLAIFFSAVMIWDRNAGHQYLFFTQPFKVIIMAAGIYFAADWLAQKISQGTETKKQRSRVFIILVLYFLLAVVNFSFFFSRDSFFISPRKWNYPNYAQTFRYFLNRKEPGDVLITRELNHYYLDKSQTEVFNYGGDENKLTLDQVKDLQNKYQRVWLITTDGEFNIKGDAEDYIEENFELIKTNYTNDKIRIYVGE